MINILVSKPHADPRELARTFFPDMFANGRVNSSVALDDSALDDDWERLREGKKTRERVNTLLGLTLRDLIQSRRKLLTRGPHGDNVLGRARRDRQVDESLLDFDSE